MSLPPFNSYPNGQNVLKTIRQLSFEFHNYITSLFFTSSSTYTKKIIQWRSNYRIHLYQNNTNANTLNSFVSKLHKRQMNSIYLQIPKNLIYPNLSQPQTFNIHPLTLLGPPSGLGVGQPYLNSNIFQTIGFLLHIPPKIDK